MRSTTVHLMAFKRFAAPTPMIATEILCVVETATPTCVAARMTAAEEVSAAKPLIGCSFTILWPRVRMMRHPPTAVPAAMVRAQTTLIHTAISISLPGAGAGERKKESQPGRFSNCPNWVAPRSVSAMIPIVFCASFVPCMKPMPPALKICAIPKNRPTLEGRTFLNNKYSTAMTEKPKSRPASGDVTIGMITFQRRPLPNHQCLSLGTDQIITFQLFPAAANAAPHKPPTKAWLELEGSPNHQVTRSQMIAPIKAHSMMSELMGTSLASTKPDEIVLATAVPQSAP